MRSRDQLAKTQGEIEAAVCEGISRFELEYMGRGPKDIQGYLLGDLLVIRLKGVLTAAEQQLVKTLPAEKGVRNHFRAQVAVLQMICGMPENGS